VELASNPQPKQQIPAAKPRKPPRLSIPITEEIELTHWGRWRVEPTPESPETASVYVQVLPDDVTQLVNDVVKRLVELGVLTNRPDLLSPPLNPMEPAMSLRINDTAPNFTAKTTQGTINFHDWIGDSWAVLFSHPKDFTPVCTTELGYMAKIEPEFTKRNTKIIGLSVDPVESHAGWVADIEETQGAKVNYPMIGDTDLAVAKLYNMLPADEAGGSDGRTAATNATVRSVFIIGPDKKIKLMLTYPMSTGRNFDEILRVLDSVQLTAKHKVATPVNWKNGDDVIVAPSVTNDEAAKAFPGFKTIKPYLRTTRQPG